MTEPENQEDRSAPSEVVAADHSGTSENSEKYADFAARALAALIDGVIVAIPINILFGGPSQIASGMNALILALAFLGYKVYFETSDWQATPGKMLMRLKVQTVSGGRLEYQQAVIRSTPYWLPSLLGFLSGILAFIAALVAVVSFVAVMSRERNQGYHDTAAGSVVVKV